MSIADCEDSIDMMRWVSFTLACSKADISEKFNWLSCVPWLFVEADKQEQALEILAQIDSKQESEHDPLTITLGNRHREDLVACAMGNGCSDSLQNVVVRYDNGPLDEGAGESIHRLTNLESNRSTNARLPCIKASIRHAQVLQRCRQLMKTFGARGRAVINTEKLLYKRVLQVKKGSLWKNVRMRPKDFYKRLYRMDDRALEDWEPLLPRPSGGSSGLGGGDGGDDAPKKGPSWTPSQAMQSEYLVNPIPIQIRSGAY